MAHSLRATTVGPLTAAALASGVLLLVTPATIASAMADGLFSGTYAIAPFGDVVHVTSNCPRCDAVGTGRATVTMTWNGAGWVRAWDMAGCGPVTTIATPTLVNN